MKRTITAFAAGAALLAFSGCAATQYRSEHLIPQAKALDTQFAEAFSRGDVEGVMQAYWKNPDVVLFPPDEMEVRGWDNIKECYSQAFAERPGARLELTESNYESAGDQVFGWGRWRMTIPRGRGTHVQIEGRYSEVQAWRNGRMVYLIDHASAPFPPAPLEHHWTKRVVKSTPAKHTATKKTAAKHSAAKPAVKSKKHQKKAAHSN